MKQILERGATGNTMAGQSSIPTVRQRNVPSVREVLPVRLSRQAQTDARHVQDAMHPAINAQQKSADGRLATQATRLNGDGLMERREQQCALASTGLLMEGLDPQAVMSRELSKQVETFIDLQ